MTTFNPADLSGVTLSGGNLTESGSVLNNGVRSNGSISTGKIYFEFKFNNASNNNSTPGLTTASGNLTGIASNGLLAAIVNGQGTVNVNGTNLGSFLLGTFAINAILCVAVDVDNRLVWFRNGTAGNWNGSGTANPATGAGGFSLSGLGAVGTPLFAFSGGNAISTSTTVNFGAISYTGAIPSGFTSWDATVPSGATMVMGMGGFVAAGEFFIPPSGAFVAGAMSDLRGKDFANFGTPVLAFGPVLDLNFAAGQYVGAGAGRLLTSRNSIGTAVDSNGNWTTFAANQPRITNLGLLIEEQRTNSNRNSACAGAVAGTPGTLPNFWGVGNNGGLTVTIVGTGIASNGVNYVDIRFNGTSTATIMRLLFDSTTGNPAAQNQVWTASQFMAIVGGSLTNVNNCSVTIQERGAGGAGITQATSTITLNATLTRYSTTYTLPSSTAQFATSALDLTLVNASAIDITVRVGWPCLEQGAYATSPIPTTNAMITRQTDNVSLKIAVPPSYSFYGEGRPQPPIPYANDQAMLNVSDSTLSNRAAMFRLGTNGNMGVSGTGTFGTPSANAFNGVISGTPSIAVGALVKGGDALTGSSGLNTFNIGARPDASQVWNGTISRVALWSSALSGAQLQQITT